MHLSSAGPSSKFIDNLQVKKFPLVWHSKVYSRVHKNPTPTPNRQHVEFRHTLTLFYSKNHCTISLFSHLH